MDMPGRSDADYMRRGVIRNDSLKQTVFSKIKR